MLLLSISSLPLKPKGKKNLKKHTRISKVRPILSASHAADPPLALAKALEAARISSTRPDSVPSAEAHAAALNKYDSTKFSLMKAISDMQSEIGSKEAELAALKEEARKLEEYDPATEHEKELDGSVYVGSVFVLAAVNERVTVGCDWGFTRH